eukprot:Tamp_31858.p1 GENE.Tamp_31858~~Tamp_31858.p1  ORF type:complete len:120 (-),score=12.66 Tamp_31858:249-608(-)
MRHLHLLPPPSAPPPLLQPRARSATPMADKASGHAQGAEEAPRQAPRTGEQEQGKSSAADVGSKTLRRSCESPAAGMLWGQAWQGGERSRCRQEDEKERERIVCSTMRGLLCAPPLNLE